MATISRKQKSSRNIRKGKINEIIANKISNY